MVGIIGFGKMGEAIASGLKNKGFEIGVFDVSLERKSEAQKQGFTVFSSNRELVEKCNKIFLAVKPQVFSNVAGEIRDVVSQGHLFISIMAGVSSQKIKKVLDKGKIVRVMPNTPALVGEGAIAVSFPEDLSVSERNQVEEMLAVLGRVTVVDECYMDAVTALSGSGPAYVFLFLEALIDAGVRQGLSRDIAMELAFQTLKGSVKLFESLGGIPRSFIDMVTSPGGTTIAALHVLERAGFKGIIMDAIDAATRRSKELGN